MRDRNFYSEIGSKDVKLVIEEYYFYLTSGRNIRNRYFQAPKERPFLSRVSLFLEINASINYLSRETMAAITILLFYPSTRRFHSNIFCFERQNPFREKEISLRVSIGGDVGWNNYEGLERFFETAREQRVRERMGPKGLEIRAENLDFFLKEAHASEALFREDNPLRDAEETCPNLVSLYLSLSLSLWFLFRSVLCVLANGNANTREREHGRELYTRFLFDSVPRSLWTGTMFSQQ